MQVNRFLLDVHHHVMELAKGDVTGIEPLVVKLVGHFDQQGLLFHTGIVLRVEVTNTLLNVTDQDRVKTLLLLQHKQLINQGGNCQAAVFNQRQPFLQAGDLLPTELPQVLVLKNLFKKEVFPELVVEFVKRLLVAEKTANLLFAETDVLHKGELIDHRGGIIVTIKVGDDVGEMLKQGQVGPFMDLFVTRLPGFQQDMLKGMVAVFTRLALGVQQQRHILGVDAGVDLGFGKEDAFQDLPGFSEVILFIKINQLVMLEHFVEGIKERRRNLVTH